MACEVRKGPDRDLPPISGPLERAMAAPAIAEGIAAYLSSKEVPALALTHRSINCSIQEACQKQKERVAIGAQFQSYKQNLELAKRDPSLAPITLHREGDRLSHRVVPLSFWTRYRAYKHDFSSDILRNIGEIEDLVQRFNTWYKSPLPRVSPVQEQILRERVNAQGKECIETLFHLIISCYEKESALIANARLEALLFKIMSFFENLFYPNPHRNAPNLPSLSIEDSRWNTMRRAIWGCLPHFEKQRFDLYQSKVPCGLDTKKAKQFTEVQFDDGKTKQVKFSFVTDEYSHMKIYMTDPKGKELGFITLTKVYNREEGLRGPISEDKEGWRSYSGSIKPAKLVADISPTSAEDYDYYYAILLQVAVEVFSKEIEFPLLQIETHRAVESVLVSYGFDLPTIATGEPDMRRAQALSQIQAIRSSEEDKRLFPERGVSILDESIYRPDEAHLTRSALVEKRVSNKMDMTQVTSWQEILKTASFFSFIEGRILPRAISEEFEKKFLRT